MALTMRLTTADGIIVQAAYIKIKSITVFQDEEGNGHVTLELSVWKNAASRAGGDRRLQTPDLDKFKFPFDLGADIGAMSLHAAAYGLLKARSAFTGASDA
ncbi:MAG: hypothetical protein VW338_18635 [Rhodospirillaceae bacterium]